MKLFDNQYRTVKLHNCTTRSVLTTDDRRDDRLTSQLDKFQTAVVLPICATGRAICSVFDSNWGEAGLAIRG